MQTNSYVEAGLTRWRRTLLEAQERLRDLGAVTGDVHMFDEQPDHSVGQLVESGGRKMVVAQVTKPGDVLGIQIGKGVYYNNFPNAKYAVHLVEVTNASSS